MRLYYLSSEKYMLDDLDNKHVKISLLNDLNDPFELLSVDLPKREYRAAFNRLKNQLNKTRGVICFSTQWENPVLWSHYADKHKGICLGFEIPDDMIAKVDYTGKRLVVDIERLLESGKLNEEKMLKILTTKFEDWHYESEYRIFVNLSEKDSYTGLYFKDFGKDLELREVIIGARCKTSRTKIKAYLKSYTPKVKIISARLAFRTFRVIPNLSKN